MTAPTGRMIDWNVKWNDVSLGTVGKVDPSNLQINFKPVTRGTTGPAILGEMCSGITGVISVECMDVSASLITELCPWQTSGELIPLAPNADFYQYAQVLNFHPTDVAAGTLTEDINFVKAVPASFLKLSRDGNNQDKLIVDFRIYPDRARLTGASPVLLYAYQGGVSP